MIKEKKMKKEVVWSMIIIQQAYHMRYGDQFDELDRVTDLGQDEFSRTVHEALDLLSMVENRLIEEHNRSQNCFSNGYVAGRGLKGSTFTQVRSRSVRGNGGNGDGGERSNGVQNKNGQFCIPIGETPVRGFDGTFVC